MKYYVCEVTRYIEPVSGKTETFSMNARDTAVDAEVLYHEKVAKAMKDKNVSMELCFGINEYGVELEGCKKHYEQIIETPEEEETTTGSEEE